MFSVHIGQTPAGIAKKQESEPKKIKIDGNFSSHFPSYRYTDSTNEEYLVNPGSDPLLLEQIRNGSEKAFTHLYDRYRHRILRYCGRLLNDRQLAEDVVQNVFIKFHTQHQSIRNGESLQRWFFTVARNDSFAELRKKRLEPLNDDILWEGELPDDEFHEKERKEIVEVALQRLHMPYREIIILREYEQLSYEEIASITGTTISSVKSRLFKARKSLIEKLKPYFT